MRTILVLTVCLLSLAQISGTAAAQNAPANLTTGSNAATTPVKMETLFNQAQEDIRNKDYTAAETKFRNVIEHSPELFNAYYNLYIILMEQNRFAEADSLLSKTTNFQLNPGQKSDVFLRLGETAEQLNNPVRALDRYHSSYTAQTNNADAIKNIAKIYLINDKIDESFFLYKKAVILKYDDYLIHLGLGNIYRKKGNNAKAIEEYKISVQQNPQYWKSHMNLGLAYSFSDMYDEAITEYRDTIELKADYPDVWFDLGNAYRYKGLFNDMESCYQKAIDLRPDFKEAIYNMSCYFAVKKNKPDSLQWLKRAISLDPGLKKKALNDGDFQFMKDDKDFKALIK